MEDAEGDADRLRDALDASSAVGNPRYGPYGAGPGRVVVIDIGRDASEATRGRPGPTPLYFFNPRTGTGR